jgi:esterase/lipase superfamily enzyme
MKDLNLFYATNRGHTGADRWHPEGYGAKFSDDGAENLRFGQVAVSADEKKIDGFLGKDVGFGSGDGEALAGYLAGLMPPADIQPYQERINPSFSERTQKNARLGSLAMFADLQTAMIRNCDVVIYIHGFDVSWNAAVGNGLALQEMLNHPGPDEPAQRVLVVLFTWPSDGKALPFVSYKSDRTEAAASGGAVGRGMLKLRDFLHTLQAQARRPGGRAVCEQDLHLLCHSMGNYVLQNALPRLDQFTSGTALPRIFENVFLCAPDVDDNVLEAGQPMGSLHELTRSVSVYHNRSDLAMYVSDYTKGNPDRLGTAGAARPAALHNKVNQIDCTPVVKGIVEHSYYIDGWVNRDIRLSIAGLPPDDPRRFRKRSADWPNVWQMIPGS